MVGTHVYLLKKKNYMTPWTKATHFICSVVLQNGFLTIKSFRFGKENLISTLPEVGSDTHISTHLGKGMFNMHIEKIHGWKFLQMPAGSLLRPITDIDLALENISASAMGKAYVTQIGRVCFRSDKLRQIQGHGVLVSHIFSCCFIEALGRRGKKQEGKRCAFLQDWKSLLCNWEIRL